MLVELGDGARTSGRSNALPFKQNRLRKRLLVSYGASWTLCGSDAKLTSYGQPSLQQRVVRVPLNFSAPEPPPTTAQGGRRQWLWCAELQGHPDDLLPICDPVVWPYCGQIYAQNADPKL